MLPWPRSLYSYQMTIEREISSNTPALVVRTQGSDRSLEAGPSYSIGRNPESDIVIDEARVSWRHAVLRLEGATWLLEDVGSTNGTFVDAQRVQRVEITNDCVLRLGHPEDGQRVWCSVAAPPRPATPANPPTAIAQTPLTGRPEAAFSPAISPSPAPPRPPGGQGAPPGGRGAAPAGQPGS
jgi:hypothetical protein